jgi:hypothetical protein
MNLKEYIKQLPPGHLVRLQFGMMTYRIGWLKNHISYLSLRLEKCINQVENMDKILNDIMPVGSDEENFTDPL